MKTPQLEKILRKASVVFNDEKHSYTASNGDLYTGCTTIAGAWRKDFMAPWYAKMAIEAVKESIPVLSLMLQGNDVQSALAKLDECKGAAARKSEEARDTGKLAHAWIESALAVKINKKGKMGKEPEGEAKNSIKAFIDWANQHEISWLASEEVIDSVEHRVAGTLDAIAVVDGLTYLIDFKTSSQFSEDALVQCAGYDVMLREMGLQVMGYMVLRLPKDGTPAETLTVTNREDMQFFRDTFLKMREAHKFFVYMNNKFKEIRKGERFPKMKVDAPQEEVKKADFLAPKKKKVKKAIKKTKKSKIKIGLRKPVLV